MLLAIAIIPIFFGVALCDFGPLVTTPLGKIRGIRQKTYANRPFTAFYGIPYAVPPLGPLRFEDPLPAKPWTGIRDGTNSSIVLCSQVDHYAIPKGGNYMGVEDCLYLNVYVPDRKKADKTKLLDVIVYIHSGAFMFGGGTSGPKFMMDRDVVLVTINYRLGVLGFLSTEDEVVPGNIGMKDQVLALKWVKDNIKSFGGNPKSVTLSGLSAGGASVHYHYLSPLSRGLFHRGISMSGVALTCWSIQENALDKAKWIGRLVGCHQNSTRALVDCLKTVEVKELTETVRDMRPWVFNPFSPLALVVEKAGRNMFLPEHPYMLLKQGKVYDVPWIHSVTSEDGLYPAAELLVYPEYLPKLNESWIEVAPHVLDYNYTIPHNRIDDVSRKIRLDYFKDKPISNETFFDLVHMMRDRFFSLPAEQASLLHARVTKSPVYYYYFSYVREELESLTTFFTGFDQHEGVSHGDDYMFIFSYTARTSQSLSKRDKQMQDIFLDMWTSFAKTNVPRIKNVTWEPVSKSIRKPLKQLHIQSPENIFMEDVTNIDMHRSMWKQQKFEENENLFKQ